jgi:hypothetical protein
VVGSTSTSDPVSPGNQSDSKLSSVVKSPVKGHVASKWSCVTVVAGVLFYFVSGNYIDGCGTSCLIGGSGALASSLDNFKEGNVRDDIGTMDILKEESTTHQVFFDTFNQIETNLRGKNKEDGGGGLSFSDQAALSGDDPREIEDLPILVDDSEALPLHDKSEMEVALSNLEDELEIVRQARELEANESKNYLLALDLDDQDINCTTVMHAWNVFNFSSGGEMSGTDFETLKEACDKGSITSSEEVARESTRLNGLHNITIEEQLTNMANEICANTLIKANENMSAVHAACTEEPRDVNSVVDASARAVKEQKPDNDAEGEMAEICRKREENRTEIDMAMVTLEKSVERRLGMSPDETHVTGFEVATDMLSMYDCFCDTNNQDNEGCTEKALKFVEVVGAGIEDQVGIDLSPDKSSDFLEDLRSKLETHTSHLRDSDSSQAIIPSKTRIMNDLELGKCTGNRVECDYWTGGCTLCITAGPLFSCEASWDPSTSACGTVECEGGKVAKLKVTGTVCGTGFKPTIELKLDICVAAFSQVLAEIGDKFDAVEKILNEFGIYSGCYRLGEATYDVSYSRLVIKATPPPFHVPFTNIFFSMDAKAYIRFKGYDCIYMDDEEWFYREYAFTHIHGGDFSIMSNANKQLQMGNEMKRYWESGQKCLYKISEWVQFTVRFRVYIDFGFYKYNIFSFSKGFAFGWAVCHWC